MNHDEPMIAKPLSLPQRAGGLLVSLVTGLGDIGLFLVVTTSLGVATVLSDTALWLGWRLAIRGTLAIAGAVAAAMNRPRAFIYCSIGAGALTLVDLARIITAAGGFVPDSVIMRGVRGGVYLIVLAAIWISLHRQPVDAEKT